MKRICYVTTTPLIVNFFLVPHLRHLSQRYEVALAVTLPGEVALHSLPGVEVIGINIPRKVDPVRDAHALLKLRDLYTSRAFDLVHSFAPKAGLLSALAGKLAGTRLRLHTFTGQVWAARAGLSRIVLRGADRITARMATHILADSASQRDFLIREGVVRAGQCEVLGVGSISGVDLERFRPDPELRVRVRKELGISIDSPVVLFLGRITRDKGVLDLADAYARTPGDARLVLVGPDEERLVDQVRARSGKRAPYVHHVGYTDVPERYLAAANILCLPSYREGFGSVVIEAAAVGVPALASRIYGIVDAVADGETGLLFQPGNVTELQQKLTRLVEDAQLRQRLAQGARERAIKHFDQRRIVVALQSFYERL